MAPPRPAEDRVVAARHQKARARARLDRGRTRPEGGRSMKSRPPLAASREKRLRRQIKMTLSRNSEMDIDVQRHSFCPRIIVQERPSCAPPVPENAFVFAGQARDH
eukprot:1442932-Pyramimonas_sp.AAC.1